MCRHVCAGQVPVTATPFRTSASLKLLSIPPAALALTIRPARTGMVKTGPGRSLQVYKIHRAPRSHRRNKQDQCVDVNANKSLFGNESETASPRSGVQPTAGRRPAQARPRRGPPREWHAQKLVRDRTTIAGTQHGIANVSVVTDDASRGPISA